MFKTAEEDLLQKNKAQYMSLSKMLYIEFVVVDRKCMCGMWEKPVLYGHANICPITCNVFTQMASQWL